MFKKLFDSIRFSIRFGNPSRHHKHLLSLAKVEYGRDWQWAYNELINGRTPEVLPYGRTPGKGTN